MKALDYSLAAAKASELARVLEAVFSRSPIGVAVIDADGYFRQINPAYCALYGYTEQEMIGRSFTMVFPEDRRELTLKRHQRFLFEGAELRGEFDVVRRDGSHLSVITESVRLPGEDGRPLRLVYVVDITERRRAEDALRQSEQVYRTLFETVPQGVVYHGLDGRVLRANPAAQRILGRTLDELQGRAHGSRGWNVIRPDGSPLPEAERPAWRTLKTCEPVRGEQMGIVVPGRGVTWIEVTTIPVLQDGRLFEVYACFEDVTDRLALSRELAKRASTDFLTGLANRRSLSEHLLFQWEQTRCHDEHRCAVLSVDIDFFKHVNDSHGHAVGDQVLKAVAAIMTGQVRSSDLVCRHGGEEFMLVLPDARLEDAVALAERLRATVESHTIRVDGTELAVTISIGVSTVSVRDTAPELVLARADDALYDAKRAGRNRVSVRDVARG